MDEAVTPDRKEERNRRVDEKPRCCLLMFPLHVSNLSFSHASAPSLLCCLSTMFYFFVPLLIILYCTIIRNPMHV